MEISRKYTPNEIFNLKKNDFILPEIVSKNLNSIHNILVSRNKKIISKYHQNGYNKVKYNSQMSVPDINSNKKEIISILNKISNNNFETSLQDIHKLVYGDTTNEYNKFITENIFKNSIKQTIFCKNYVKILLTFRSDEIISEKIREFDNYIFNDKNQKHLKSGYANFLTELFNVELISTESFQFIISGILKNILKNKMLCEDYVECLFTISKIMDNNDILREVLSSKITEMLVDKEIPSRSRFKLMDIKDSL